MAEAQLDFQPSHDIMLEIIELMKDFYEKEPGAETPHMIHHVFVQLQDRMDCDELPFGQSILRMINHYLDLCDAMGNPNIITDQLQGFLTDECPYFMTLHEALQSSHLYRQPITSSATTSTPGQPDTVYNHLYSQSTSSEDETEMESVQSEAEALNAILRLCQQHQISDECIGEYDWSDDYEVKIARCMKEHYMEHPSSLRIEMIDALHRRVNPDEDFDNFLQCVDNMIGEYRSIRRAMVNTDISPTYKESLISSCLYFNDIHHALLFSDQYRDVNWTL